MNDETYERFVVSMEEKYDALMLDAANEAMSDDPDEDEDTLLDAAQDAVRTLLLDDDDWADVSVNDISDIADEVAHRALSERETWKGI